MKNASVYVPLTTGKGVVLRLRTGLRRVWLQLQRWWELAEQRRQLALLDEHALHDLGLSRAAVIRESERPFWDDPLATPAPAGEHSASRRLP